MKNNSLFIILQKMRMPFLVIIITYTIAIIGLISIEGINSNGEPYHMSIFDAFYFVSYTATTIGFGETPYEFTYPQRLWVTFSIYITVIGWFYGIGSLVTLLQDKLFIQEIEKARFLRQVKRLNEKFIIILGYNNITKIIIEKAMQQGIRAVVIETDKSKINDLILKNFTPKVPALYSEKYSIRALEQAGVKKRNCKAVVSLFEDDVLNLKITLISKLLNKYIKVAVTSTTVNHTENLKDLNAGIIVNPFSIISSEVNMALVSPNLFKLEKWLYQLDTLSASLPVFPKGTYIICGYGRMGRRIYEKLKANDVEAKLIEIDSQKEMRFSSDELSNLTFGDADDKVLLDEVGAKDAVAIIAATDDDTTNISILATSKKLNPSIMTIARVNELEDAWIFKRANIDHAFIPSKIVINKITNSLVNPLSDIFIRKIIKKDDVWASKLVSRLITEIDETPLVLELEINERSTPHIYKFLSEKNYLSLEILATSLHNYEQNNNLVPLLLQRGKESVLLPLMEHSLKIGDKILLACDEHAKSDLEYICLNVQEFYYALTGEEKKMIFKRKKR